MYKNIVEQAAKKAGAGLEYKDKKSTATAEVYFFRHGNRNRDRKNCEIKLSNRRGAIINDVIIL